MSVLLAVARREFASLFRVPLGWLALAFFTLISSWLFVKGVLVPGAPATMRPIFSTMGWLLLPVAPAISMRLFSEELRSGTIEPLQSSPASDYAVVFGKFLGAMAFLAALMLPTLVHAAVLWSYATPAPDPGPLIAGYLSVALLAGLFLSAGLLVSTATSNQTLAFLGAMVLILAMLVGPELASQALPTDESTLGGKVRNFILALRVGTRLEDFAKGVIDAGHIVAFVAWTGAFLVASAVSLESRRWRSVRSFSRALKFGGVSVALLSAMLVSAVLATLLGDRIGRRFDVTSTGEHRLTARTATLMRDVQVANASIEIIVAADWLAMDRRVREDLRDVLARFGREGNSVAIKTIDFAAASGRDEYGRLLARLAESQSAELTAAKAAVADALTRTPPLRTDLATVVVPGVDSLIATVPDIATLGPIVGRVQQAAAAVASTARGLAAAEERASTLLSRQIENVPVPAVDEAAANLRAALEASARQLLALEGELKALASAQPRAATNVRAAADGVRVRRELADTIADRLRTVPDLDVLRVAAAVGESSALIVRVDPAPRANRLRAQPLAKVIRPGESSADTKRRVESEISTAIAALTDPAPPIVVFLSSDPALAAGYQRDEEAAARLRERGVDVVWWDLIVSADPPSLAKLNPGNSRPVVYVVRMPDQTQLAYGQVAGGIERARQLADVAKGLSESGAGVLVCLSPAAISQTKEADAADRVLGPFGLIPRTDRPLFAEVRASGGSAVDVNAAARASVRVGTPHPFADAVGGATVLLPWATAVTATLPETQNVLDVVSSATWGESRWIDLRRAIAEGRTPSSMPRFDAGEDDRAGRWTVVATGEIGARRAVAVGSADWLSDALLRQRTTVDGRIVQVAAGNLDLFDAAISWLSGREVVSARGGGGSVAVVGSLSDDGRSRVAWILIAGLPLVVLGLGVGYRVVRG